MTLTDSTKRSGELHGWDDVRSGIPTLERRSTEIISPLCTPNIDNLRQRNSLKLFGKIVAISIIWLCGQIALCLPVTLPIKIMVWLGLGYVMVGLYVLGHELVHQRLFNKNWLDNILGILIMSPCFVSFLYYRKGHMLHHKYSTTERDPGYVLLTDKDRVIKWIVTAFHYMNASYILAIPLGLLMAFRSRKLKIAAIAISQGIALPSLAVFIGGVQFGLSHVLIPYCSFCLFITIKNAAEHDYLYQGPDGYLRQDVTTRSIRASLLTRFFWSNCNYHIEHHLYPSIPYWNLPKVFDETTRARHQYVTYYQFLVTRMRQGVPDPIFN